MSMEWLDFLPPLAREMIKIGVIVLLGVFAGLGVHLAGRVIERRMTKDPGREERKLRLRTLVQVGISIADIIIGGTVLLMILHELDINIAPLLASAGLAGLALSLGAQTLIRDFLGGVLVLVENIYNVGDWVQVGDQRGKVERISLRATYMRNLEGEIIIVPNGDIRTIRNLTTDWSRAVITLNVPRNADMEKVMQALSRASQAVLFDQIISPHLLESPEAEGWIDLTESAIQVRFMVKTSPGKQWQVAQALRKYAFQALSDAKLPSESG